jgi:beta-phosphoglucomutase
MLRAVIFDFDGVITDSEILHLRAFNQVLAAHGIEISTQEYYKVYLGMTDVDCYKLLIRKGMLRISEEEIGSLIEKKYHIFEKLARTEGHIIEGARDFVLMLSQNKLPLAICSGSLMAEIELILGQAQLRRYFTAIVSGDQMKKSKPDPQGYLLTLQKLNRGRQEPILASQCVVIEDSHWGLKAAIAAGMHTIAVTNSYDAEQLAMAEKIVARLSELSISDLQQLCP